MDKQTIIEKIKKLIRLRDGAQAIGSEAEAQAAAAGIQRLLTQYNLDIADVDVSDIEIDYSFDLYKEMGRSRYFETADPYRCGWKRQLLSVISEAYYCKAYQVHGKSLMVVYGTEVNRFTVEYVFNFLEETFNRLVAVRAKEQGVLNTRMSGRITWISSYLLGCASGTYDKLKEQRNNSQINALMVSHAGMIERYLKEEIKAKVGTTRSHSSKTYNGYAYSLGEKDARKQQIAKAIQ